MSPREPELRRLLAEVAPPAADALREAGEALLKPGPDTLARLDRALELAGLARGYTFLLRPPS